MEYELKDKLQVTKEFLNDLEVKSWQEIEHLQNQIVNIEATKENLELIQLLKNLLTSYYVFTGGLENLNDNTNKLTINEPKSIESIKLEPEATFSDEFVTSEVALEQNMDSSEPFEYFVDFDEPVGEPLTDEELYNN